MLISRISGCTGSANRAKKQIYLIFSEVSPIFKLRSRLKVVQNGETAKESFSYLLVLPLILFVPLGVCDKMSTFADSFEH